MSRKVSGLQVLVHAAALAPLAWLVFDAAAGNLSANPIQDITQRTGRYALILLVLSLSCTPAFIVSGWAPVTRWRRPLGVYAFLYASLHFLTFAGLDYGFDLGNILADVAGKRYILAGAAALVVLAPLAMTSTRRAQKRLGKAWPRLHRWAYLAGALVVVHYVWAVKSDIRQPLAWGAVVALGFLLRLPPLRRYFTGLRRGRRKHRGDAAAGG